jgi:hypothetical protein
VIVYVLPAQPFGGAMRWKSVTGVLLLSTAPPVIGVTVELVESLLVPAQRATPWFSTWRSRCATPFVIEQLVRT